MEDLRRMKSKKVILNIRKVVLVDELKRMMILLGLRMILEYYYAYY